MAVAAFAALAVVNNVAHAQQEGLDDERARAHYLAGESHFAAERWADASREFEQAYSLSQRPEMLINLSRAHERGGELPAAIADLELLLGRFPETSYRLEAEQRIAVMRSKLAAAPPPVVEQPVEAEPQQPAEPPPPPRAKIWPPHLPTLIVGSAAIATGVASLATGLRAHGLHGDLQDRCPNDSCQDGFESDRDKGRALSRASTGLMFGSIALAGATAALWVLDYKHDKRMQLGFNGSSVKLHMQF